MENEIINELTVEDLNSVLQQAVDSKNHELVDWLLHSKKLNKRPDIQQQKNPDNPILTALKNNDVTCMLLLCHNSVKNELLQDTVAMNRCLEFASESQMWDMCHFLTDVISHINPFIPYKYALSYKQETEALLFYDKIKDKADAFMCACLYGSEILFDKAKEEKNININYDLSFANIIKSENHVLLDKFLNLYENEINWLKHDYFVKKIIDTENVENLKYILNHKKIKDNFNLTSYRSYFTYLIAKKNEEPIKDMLDYLVLEYAIKFNGVRINSNQGERITQQEKEFMEKFLEKRDNYIALNQRYVDKTQNVNVKPTKVKKI